MPNEFAPISKFESNESDSLIDEQTETEPVKPDEKIVEKSIESDEPSPEKSKKYELVSPDTFWANASGRNKEAKKQSQELSVLLQEIKVLGDELTYQTVHELMEKQQKIFIDTEKYLEISDNLYKRMTESGPIKNLINRLQQAPKVPGTILRRDLTKDGFLGAHAKLQEIFNDVESLKSETDEVMKDTVSLIDGLAQYNKTAKDKAEETGTLDQETKSQLLLNEANAETKAEIVKYLARINSNLSKLPYDMQAIEKLLSVPYEKYLLDLGEKHKLPQLFSYYENQRKVLDKRFPFSVFDRNSYPDQKNVIANTMLEGMHYSKDIDPGALNFYGENLDLKSAHEVANRIRNNGKGKPEESLFGDVLLPLFKKYTDRFSTYRLEGESFFYNENIKEDDSPPFTNNELIQQNENMYATNIEWKNSNLPNHAFDNHLSQLHKNNKSFQFSDVLEMNKGTLFLSQILEKEYKTFPDEVKKFAGSINNPNIVHTMLRLLDKKRVYPNINQLSVYNNSQYATEIRKILIDNFGEIDKDDELYKQRVEEYLNQIETEK